MKNKNFEKLIQLLQRKPEKTSALLLALEISQPTFSRLWSMVENGIVLGAGKARQYALRREVPGVVAPIPVFHISEQGKIASIGQLEILQGGFYALTATQGTGYRLYQGIPYFLRDLRPQGFLGRLEPAKNRDLDLPADILRWSDEHVLKYVTRRSENAAGNLIVGNESYARYLTLPASATEIVLPESMRHTQYPSMAEKAMLGESPGSSAGGEQPKFTAVIQRAGEAECIEHVIVKFSPRTDTQSGRRWGDLLICEHLALQILTRNKIAAAKTSILEAGQRIFLEVVRFDRIGATGRRPMVTLAALDGDLGMMDQSWSVAAQQLGRLGQLSAQDIATVEQLDLFGTLIGNTDKHHGNMALAWTFEQKVRLLDAYDMLPMLYRPNTHGEIIKREWQVNFGAQLALKHLPQCYKMACQFWTEVLNDARISAEFKENVAHLHFNTLRKLEVAGGIEGA